MRVKINWSKLFLQAKKSWILFFNHNYNSDKIMQWLSWTLICMFSKLFVKIKMKKKSEQSVSEDNETTPRIRL